MREIRFSICTIVLALGWASAAQAIELGQVDDFEDGTTMGWGVGSLLNPNPPENVPDGGPLGAGDAYLRIRGNGQPLSPGSKPTAINGGTGQWTGNYTAAGVLQISADLRNAGPTQLDIRLQIGGLQSFVTAPVMLPSGSSWVHATWKIDAASLLPLFGANDPAGTLAQVFEVRIFHNPEPTDTNAAPRLVAELHVDNIRAEGASADRDGDGVADAADNCPFLANADQLDRDGNRRGNACECGDQNGDATVDVADLVAINVAIFNPAQVTPLCDANGDSACNVNDIIAANIEIFSQGNTSTCTAQPQPGP
jgi:hypothetical protein